MKLRHALHLDRPLSIAFVGAGGKSTAMFQLARELCSLSEPQRKGEVGFSGAVVTATTHLSEEQAQWADRHWIIGSDFENLTAPQNLPDGVLLFTGQLTAEKRYQGMNPLELERIRRAAQVRQLPLLIEADGSRRLPLKAPADHEPAIPGFVDAVIVVASLAALGEPAGEQTIHRPERFYRLTGLRPGEPITARAIASVMSSSQGGLKNIPPGARRIALITHAATAARQVAAEEIAGCLREHYHRVIVARSEDPRSSMISGPAAILDAISIHEPVAGVILAAGGAKRYGAQKLLLPWAGEPVIRCVARRALEAGLEPVIAVTGANNGAVSAALAGLDVTIIHNPEWENGQSTSLKAGVLAIPDGIDSALFLLGDQPQIPRALIAGLLGRRRLTQAQIIVPQVAGRRANPVLFDRDTFQELLALQGDTGGRPLFAPDSGYEISGLPWEDPQILLDIDTPEDYRRLLGLHPGLNDETSSSED